MKKKIGSLSEYENEVIDVSDREFNSQNLFFLRVHKICERRDLAAEMLNLISYAAACLSLFKEVKPKLIKEKIEGVGEIEDMLKFSYKKVMDNEYINRNNAIERDNNRRTLFLELWEGDSLLTQAIHLAGIIYPKHKTMTIEEIAEKDY